MKKLIFVFSFLLLFSQAFFAQKGTAEPDYYPSGYSGDIWMGVVTAVDEATREFTLTYKKGDKEQTFVGILQKGYSVKNPDGTEYEIKMSDLMGLKLRAYYQSKTKKVDAVKVKTNEVFQIKTMKDK